MSLKVFWIGLAGGIISSGFLVYPAYIYLPGTLIEGWYRSIPEIAYVMLCLSVIAIFLSGVAGARWSNLVFRRETAIAGALSGLIASLTAYGMVAGTAVGIWGSRPILLHGLVPSANDSVFLELIAESTGGILWWGSLSLLMAAGAGLVLGGVGGALVKAKHPDRSGRWPEISVAVSIFAILISGFSLLVAFAVYGPLDQSLSKAAATLDRELTFSTTQSVMIIHGINYLWYLAWQVILWINIHSLQKSRDDQTLTWVFSSFVSLILPGIMACLWAMVLELWYVYAAGIISLVIGLLTFRDTFWLQRKRKLQTPTNPLKSFPRFYRIGMVISALLVLTLIINGTNVVLNLVMVVISAIAYVMPGPGSTGSMTLPWLISYTFKTIAWMFPTSFTISAFYLLAVLWTIRNLLIYLVEYGSSIIATFERRRLRRLEGAKKLGKNS